MRGTKLQISLDHEGLITPSLDASVINGRLDDRPFAYMPWVHA